MSKPIINGIDVSECEFLEYGMCNAQRNCDGYTGIECKYDNENCYYRQLKRLQEENKELRQIRKNSPDIQEPYIYLYRQIKKQCHKLKEENKRLQMLSCANCGEKYLSPEGAELYDKMRDYKDALEEIKDRATMPESLPESYTLRKYILEKCNEVLNDRD